MKINLAILIILLSISSVIATESLGIVEKGTCISLKQSCADCDYVNISAITYPNKVTTIAEWNMEKQGIMYNYTFCNTYATGQYIVDGHGGTWGNSTIFSYDFEVKDFGDTQDTGLTQASLFILLAIIVSLFVYLKVSRFFGSFMIFIIGFIVLFSVKGSGIGWIIIASGFIMLLYAIMTPKRRH